MRSRVCASRAAQLICGCVFESSGANFETSDDGCADGSRAGRNNDVGREDVKCDLCDCVCIASRCRYAYTNHYSKALFFFSVKVTIFDFRLSVPRLFYVELLRTRLVPTSFRVAPHAARLYVSPRTEPAAVCVCASPRSVDARLRCVTGSLSSPAPPLATHTAHRSALKGTCTVTLSTHSSHEVGRR